MKAFLPWLFALTLILGAALPGRAEEFGNSAEYVCISVKDYGDIYAELYPEIAPITVENFMKLVN